MVTDKTRIERKAVKQTPWSISEIKNETFDHCKKEYGNFYSFITSENLDKNVPQIELYVISISTVNLTRLYKTIYRESYSRYSQ